MRNLFILILVTVSFQVLAQSAECDSILKYKDKRGCIRYSISENLFVKQWVDGQTLDTIHDNLVILERENDSIRAAEAEVRKENKALRQSMQRNLENQEKKESFTQHSLDACKQYNSDLTKANENLNQTVDKLKGQRKGAFLIGGGLGAGITTILYFGIRSFFH